MDKPEEIQKAVKKLTTNLLQPVPENPKYEKPIWKQKQELLKG